MSNLKFDEGVCFIYLDGLKLKLANTFNEVVLYGK